jgi:hypothetical protein
MDGTPPSCHAPFITNNTKSSRILQDLASSLFGPSRWRHISPDDLGRERPVIHYLELKDARQNLRGAETGPEVQIPIDDRSRVEIARNCVPLSSLSDLSIGSYDWHNPVIVHVLGTTTREHRAIIHITRGELPWEIAAEKQGKITVGARIKLRKANGICVTVNNHGRPYATRRPIIYET